MGNKGSTDAPAPGSLSTSQPREDNVYEDYTSSTSPSLSSITRPAPSLPPPTAATGTPPPPVARPFPPDHRPRSHGPERRSMTIVGRGEQQRKNDLTHRRLSTSDAVLSSDPTVHQDTLQSHVVASEPQAGEEGVELAAVIAVVFNRDVVTVNPSALFEVKCDMDTLDATAQPVQGRTTYDAKTLRTEFIPHTPLHPDTTYTVTLLGRAVTTVQCSSSTNISNAQFTFKTCNPPPKNIGIKLKGHRGEAEKLQIANYYDLYNSLIVWSTKQWGCSGEHIMGLYVESEDRGRLQVLKADHDILRLRENEVVVVEIKD